MDSLLLELDKVGSEKRTEVLNWRTELDAVRNKWAPAPQTARARKPLSTTQAMQREARPTRRVAKPPPPVSSPVVPATAPRDGSSSTQLQQRNAMLEMAVAAMAEALEASGGLATSPSHGGVSAVMERLREAGVSLGDASYVPLNVGDASYLPFSPGQLPGHHARLSLVRTPGTEQRTSPPGTEQRTSPPGAPASPEAEEPEWLVDAAATLAAEKEGS